MRFLIKRRLECLGQAAATACILGLSSGCPLSDAYFIDADAGPDGKMPMPKPKPMMDAGPAMMMPDSKAMMDAGGSATMPAARAMDSTSSTAMDLARGKMVAASSEQMSKGNWAPLANDGDPTTRWSASEATVPSWWRVDLGAVHSLTRVEIDWEFARAYGYLIETSSDDSNYVMRVDRSTSTDTTQKQFADVNASARYVRITVTAVTPMPISWPSFWEVRVFGH